MAWFFPSVISALSFSQQEMDIFCMPSSGLVVVSPMSTYWLSPLNEIAPPALPPDGLQIGFPEAPQLPSVTVLAGEIPERSVAVVPELSSKARRTRRLSKGPVVGAVPPP